MLTASRKLVLSAVVAASALLCGGLGAQAQEIVVPNAQENIDGNFNNAFPFSIGSFSVPSMRYQQVYAASDFAALTDPVLITELHFRPDTNSGNAFDVVLPDVQINLSTTPTAPDALSLTFADNVGSDDTIVHDGPLALSSADTGAGPRDFDIVIPLQTPFLYDPSAGNLLLDVRNFGGGTTTFFDAHNATDATSRSWTFFGTVNSPTADFASTAGLVTKFITVDPVIEVAIDIKPGSDPNSINLKKGKSNNGKSSSAGGVVPVAILSTEDFDATEVNPDTVELGDPNLGGTAAPLRAAIEDVNDDGLLDLVLHFSIEEMVAAGAIDCEESTMSTEVIVNGDFETGDFTGWSVSGNWFINNGAFDPPSPAGTQPPISGNFDAIASPTGPSTKVLCNSFVVPDNITGATLSFSDRIWNFAGAFADPNQEYRVEVLDAGLSSIFEIFSTDPGDPLQQLGPNNRMFDVTAQLQAVAGEEVCISFTEQDSLFYFNVWLDNVSLVIDQTVLATEELALTGETFDGKLIVGVDSVNLVPPQ